uniref:Retrovirus-related Pol polyprotein from transposon TNT 1-94 n=1 Tax=Tanacetum cinerariifolium TaxID=118510 RepID=A0A6L2LXE9_TANCI|nr:retrovirus-related Pol polyprotein from transposon TNT 1-94 [Tanacetum cinerariifolium]
MSSSSWMPCFLILTSDIGMLLVFPSSATYPKHHKQKEVPDIYRLAAKTKVGISHETSVAHSLQQNGVIERCNCTLIEAAHTMLIYTQALLFLWAEAVATACYTQNRSIIRLRHEKIPYEILHNKLLDLSFLHIFSALCYPTNDSENLGKLQPKADIGIFIGYAPTKKAFLIYNRRTRRIIKTIHVNFDELTTMASKQSSLGHALNEMTPAKITPKFITPIADVIPLVQAESTSSPSSTTIDQDAPSPSKSQTTPETQSSVIPQDVEEDIHDIKVTHMGNDPLFGVPILEVASAQSSLTVSPYTIISQSPRGIFINQSKYALESLKKYGFESCDPVDTPMVEKSKLDEDKEGKAVDLSHYHGMIGTLLYLTASRPDLQFAICMCVRTMDMTIDQQVALDEALVPHTSRLRIGKRNFRLESDISSKESTLQLATATVHHHSIRFKMDNKKHIINMEYFREMLHICPRLSGQTFDELPFEEEILAFLRFLGHSGEIRRLTDAQILWGLYHRRNVDFAYLMLEDFVYQLFTMIKLVSRHKNTQQFGAMLPIELTNKDIRNSEAYKEYYVVGTGATPSETKASVRKMKSSSDTTVTPLTAAAGKRLSTSAKGKQPAKASKAKSLTVLSEVAMTEAKQLKLAMKRSLQQNHISQASGLGADEGTGTIPGVLDVPTEEYDEKISWNSSDEDNDNDDDDEGSDAQDDDDQDVENKDDDDQNEGDNDDDQEKCSDDEQDSDEEGEEFIHLSLSIHDEEETKDEESFDPITNTPENTDDEGNGKENLGLNIGREEGQDEEDNEDELYRDVNINLEGRVVPTTMAPNPLSTPTLTPLVIATISTLPQTLTHLTNALSTLLQDIPNFGSLFGFNHRLKTLESNFSEFVQTNQFVGAVSSILGIVQRYMDQRMNKAVKVAVQIQSDRLRDEAQAENKEFLKNLNENIQKIIKEQVKEQVKVQVSKILPKIEQTVNEQLEAEVLTRSSNSSKTSYVVAADISEMELKKILIEKMEDTYGDTVTLKRRRDDDANKDEEPSTGLDRGSKRRREGKEPDKSTTEEEPMQTTHEMDEPLHPELETCVVDDQPNAEPSQHPEWFSQQKKPPTLDRDWNKTLPAIYGSIQPLISELAKKTDSRSSFNELMDTPVDFLTFLMNRLKVDTLTPELLAGPTFELMKGSCKSLVELEFFLKEVYKATIDQLDWNNPKGQQYPHNLLKPLLLIQNSRGHRVIPFDHFINNDLEYLRTGVSSHKYTTYVTKTKAADYGHIKWIEDLVPQTMESARDVYFKHRIIIVTELKIVEWQNYKHLDWITVCGDDDKLYKFKEGDFKRLRIQDMEDMLLLLACGRPSTRCQKLPEEAQPHKADYIDELQKFNDGTLNDVRTALDDHLKGIRMKYLPKSI